MKLEPQRIQRILLRAWRGEEPAAIAAAVLTDVRVVDDVLRAMFRRLDVRYRWHPRRKPIADELIARVHADWKAGRISTRRAMVETGLGEGSLMIRFADLGDQQAARWVEKNRDRNREYAARSKARRRGKAPPAPAAAPEPQPIEPEPQPIDTGAQPPEPEAPPAPRHLPAERHPMETKPRRGRKPRPIDQDLLLRLHDRWKRKEITLKAAGAEAGRSITSIRVRFADISDPEYAARRRDSLRRAVKKHRDAGAGQLAAFLAQPRTMEELYQARTTWRRALTWYRMARHLNISDTEVRRKAARLGDPEMIAWLERQRERARETQRAKREAEKAEAERIRDEHAARPDARMVRMRGGELRAAVDPGDQAPWSPDEPLDASRARTAAAQREADERQRRALLAEPPDPQVLALIERRARQPDGDDARDVLAMIRGDADAA